MTYLTCTALLFFGIGVYLTFHVAQQPSFNRMGTLGESDVGKMGKFGLNTLPLI